MTTEIPQDKVSPAQALEVAKALVLEGRSAEAQTFIDGQKSFWPKVASMLRVPTIAQVVLVEQRRSEALKRALAASQDRLARAQDLAAAATAKSEI